MPPLRVRLAAAALLLVAALPACGGAGVPEVDAHDAPVPDAVPPPDADLFPGSWPEAAAFIGREADAGRPVVVNLFASWCAPCRAEAPVLHEAIAAHPEIAWLGVAHLDLADDSRGFLAQYGLDEVDFPTLWDATGEVAANVGSRGLPTTAFFDHTGRLVYLHLGILTEPLLAQRVADLAAAAGVG